MLDRKIDKWLCVAALLAVLAVLLWISVPVVQRGLSSSDDAFFALVAKNVAAGNGYGWPRSSNTFLLFDHFISTGPALILPVALLIRIFGRTDQLPGAATLVINLGQFVGAGMVLARRFGWTPTCGFLAALVWLLILVSKSNWYFGSLLGEPVAFGFVLMGIALLATEDRERDIVWAALCFALAFLTKQIALFAVVGVVGIWLVINALNKQGLRLFFRRVAILVLAGSTLPILFEAVKLATLGLAGYQKLWTSESLNAVASQALGGGNPAVRWSTFWTIFLQEYTGPLLILALAAGSIVALVLQRRSRDEQVAAQRRFAVLAWGGGAVYLAYILVGSILWPRYFWIGIAVLLTAACAPLLGTSSRWRTATLLILLVGTLGLGLFRPISQLRQWIAASPAPAERDAVVRLLDANPELPYVAQWGSSVFDIVYLRDNEGSWAFEPDVIYLQNREFFAIINEVFTDKNSVFFKSVMSECKLLTPGAQVIAAYLCDRSGWPQPGSLGHHGNPPVRQVYYGAIDKRDCDTLAGWVMNTEDPKAETKVELYIDNKLVETVPANNLRPDLVDKIGTGKYGFSFRIPADYKDDKPHTAVVKVAGSNYAVPFFAGVFSAFQCQP